MTCPVHCTHTQTHTNKVQYIAQGSVRRAVHREAYTVSQPTSPFDPFRGLARWGFTTATRSSLNNRRAASEVPSRIIAQSLRLNPTACHVAKSLPSCAHRACQVLHLTYCYGWVLAQHSSQPALGRHLEWSKIAYGHAGQGRGPLASSPAAGGESFDLALPVEDPGPLPQL